MLQASPSVSYGKPMAHKADPNESLRILIIDDVEPLARTLQEGLSQLGQRVSCALSGREGVEMFMESNVDAVVSDLGMPDMNGWEVGREIKRLCESRGVAKPPFILLTGWDCEGEEESRLLESGVDALLQKPINFSELLGVMKQAMREESASRPS